MKSKLNRRFFREQQIIRTLHLENRISNAFGHGKQAARPPAKKSGMDRPIPSRVVRDLVAHHREHDVAQLPRHGRDGHAVELALSALLVVEGAQPGVGCLARLAASRKRGERYGEPCLVMEPPPLSNCPDWLTDEFSPA